MSRNLDDELDEISSAFIKLKLLHPYLTNILNRAHAFWLMYGGNKQLFPHGGTPIEFKRFMDSIILMMEIPMKGSPVGGGSPKRTKRVREFGRRKSRSRSKSHRRRRSRKC